MPALTYPQLDDHAHALLTDAVKRLGTKKAAGDAIGYSRQAVSLGLARKYRGDTKGLRAAILERFADHVLCPHLDRGIPPADCRAFRERPLTLANPEALKHWQACRGCPNNPEVP